MTNTVNQKTCQQKITAICIDWIDIRNKAALLNPNKRCKIEWLNNNISKLEIINEENKINNNNILQKEIYQKNQQIKLQENIILELQKKNK